MRSRCVHSLLFFPIPSSASLFLHAATRLRAPSPLVLSPVISPCQWGARDGWESSEKKREQGGWAGGERRGGLREKGERR